jgi:hypothetical protein
LSGDKIPDFPPDFGEIKGLFPTVKSINRIPGLFPVSVGTLTIVVILNPAHGEVYSIQHYVVSDLCSSMISLSTPVSSTNKIDRHDITEIP